MKYGTQVLELPTEVNETRAINVKSRRANTNIIPMKCYPRVRNDYDEEAAYESYMNSESGFQPGPGDSVDAD